MTNCTIERCDGQDGADGFFNVVVDGKVIYTHLEAKCRSYARATGLRIVRPMLNFSPAQFAADIVRQSSPAELRKIERSMDAAIESVRFFARHYGYDLTDSQVEHVASRVYDSWVAEGIA